jgi:hypothetical protein
VNNDLRSKITSVSTGREPIDRALGHEHGDETCIQPGDCTESSICLDLGIETWHRGLARAYLGTPKSSVPFLVHFEENSLVKQTKPILDVEPVLSGIIAFGDMPGQGKATGKGTQSWLPPLVRVLSSRCTVALLLPNPYGVHVLEPWTSICQCF